MEIYFYNDRLFGADLNFYHHFTRTFLYLHHLFSYSSVFFLWPPCVNLFASQKIKGPKCCTLKFFHYSQEVSHSLIIMQIGNYLYLQKTFHLVRNSRNENYSIFCYEIVQSLLDCKFCSGCLM